MKRLYRYRKFNEFTKDELNKSYIYLSSPLRLNDPFDCRLDAEVDLPFNKATEEISSLFDEMLDDEDDFIRELGGKIISDIQGSTEEIIALKKNYYFIMTLRKTFDQDGIVCFTDSADNSLMWFHYADGGKGICIEYAFPEDSGILNSLAAVVYTDIYPNLRMPCFSDNLDKPLNFDKGESIISKEWSDFVNQMVLTKSKEWAYENEWRLILPGYANKKLFLEENYQASIYVGSEMNYKNMSSLLNILRKKKIPPKVFRVDRKEKEFGFYFSKIEYL